MRGIALGSADRARILEARDQATLLHWLVRAATCADISALFDDPTQ